MTYSVIVATLNIQISQDSAARFDVRWYALFQLLMHLV